MSDEPEKISESILPTDFYLEEDTSDWRIKLMDEIKNIKYALNDKAIGKYSILETYTGETFFTAGNNNKERHLFRKVVDIGNLPVGGSAVLNVKSIPHGISISDNMYFINIYGVANLKSTRFIPIPFYDVTAPTKSIKVEADATDTIITVGSTGYSLYTAYIVLEYLKF